MSNPYDNFLKHLEEDESPNFLWYTLTILEKTVYAEQAEVIAAIRKKMEQKYNLDPKDVWNP